MAEITRHSAFAEMSTAYSVRRLHADVSSSRAQARTEAVRMCSVTEPGDEIAELLSEGLEVVGQVQLILVDDPKLTFAVLVHFHIITAPVAGIGLTDDALVLVEERRGDLVFEPCCELELVVRQFGEFAFVEFVACGISVIGVFVKSGGGQAVDLNALLAHAETEKLSERDTVRPLELGDGVFTAGGEEEE